MISNMSAEYRNHTYRYEIHGKQSEARGYRFERIILFIDEVQINPAPGTLYEPATFGENSADIKRQASAHAENAAKRIIDHLSETRKTVHEL